MKRIFVLVLIALLSVNAYSQKKKPVTKKTGATSGLAKVDNLVAEVKKGNFQVTINENGKEKDAMIVKAADAKFAPTNCKLTAFTANGTKLYLLTWTEMVQIKTNKKTEDITNVYSVIYEIANKKQVFSNTQTTNHITEIVSLGGTAATETQEKIRRDGFEFILNPDGSVTQKSKNQQNRWVYDVAKMEFVAKK
ncbi:hypothetical protein IVB69_11135 [Flavobacterium sp. J49]|uniref:hypothetical protein n=1 Tax=Flavobacterium sp. J49 TaxID=2718534 RepID=UPI0015935ED1|nr:hypothetical protein [Flavobacterium sp. J49]MBF6642035.1 hypothetical protein [Flavobacterium sp. J49]NIC03283.1 hypothetical protein [Flavobacterium sp. J49]